jgi:hypothetical protein
MPSTPPADANIRNHLQPVIRVTPVSRLRLVALFDRGYYQVTSSGPVLNECP